MMEQFDIQATSMKSSNKNKIKWKNSLRNTNNNTETIKLRTRSNKHNRASNRHTSTILPERLQYDGHRLEGIINTTANSRESYDFKLHAQCRILIEKCGVSTKSNDHIKSSKKNTSTISIESQNTDCIISAISDKTLYDDPKLNSQCMVLTEKSDSSTGLNKRVDSSKTNITTISIGSQNTGCIVSTVSYNTLLCDHPKLNLQCIVLIEKFNISTEWNKHVESSNKNAATMSSIASQNTDCISIVSNNTLLHDDPKFNLQCMVLIEKFNSMGLNKHVESSHKNISTTSSKRLQNNYGILNSTADYKLLGHDPKLNLRCMILIKKLDVSNNIALVKSSNLPNNIKITSKEITDEYNSNGSKMNWNNNCICTDESTETNRKVQTEISLGSYSTTNKIHTTQEDIVTCTKDENKCSNKVKIKSRVNHSTSICLWKQRKGNSAEISVNQSNEGTSSNYIFNKKVIYEKQPIGDNKLKEPIDLYEFYEFDRDKMKILGNIKYNLNNKRIFNKSMNLSQKNNMKKTKLRVKNKNKRNIERVSKAYKYHETIQGIIHKIMSKVCIKNSSANQNQESIVIGDKNMKNILEHETPTPNNSIFAKDNSIIANSSEEFFNFNCNSHSTPSNINPNVNIGNDSTNLFNNIKPIANSTMLSSGDYSPWRFSDNVKRNPHFIIIKKTALPCLQQDMVLDYSQLKKIEEHFSKSEKKIQDLKTKPVQKRILDFMNASSYDKHDQENINHSDTLNLFDYDDFSPKKIISQKSSKNTTKRNILAPTQDNSKTDQINAISNDKSLKASKSTSNNQNVFKKYTKEVTQTEIIEPNRQDSLNCLLVTNSKEVKLIEDPVSNEGELVENPEQVISLNMPSKIYGSKRGKRRLLSDASLDVGESKSKNKNKMTNEKETELEKWAVQFNGECREIEQYRLDIE